MGDSFQVGPVADSIAHNNPARGLVEMNVEVNFLNHLVEMFGQFLDLFEWSDFARRKEGIEALFWRMRKVTLRFNRNVYSMAQSVISGASSLSLECEGASQTVLEEPLLQSTVLLAVIPSR